MSISKENLEAVEKIAAIDKKVASTLLLALLEKEGGVSDKLATTKEAKMRPIFHKRINLPTGKGKRQNRDWYNLKIQDGGNVWEVSWTDRTGVEFFDEDQQKDDPKTIMWLKPAFDAAGVEMLYADKYASVEEKTDKTGAGYVSRGEGEDFATLMSKYYRNTRLNKDGSGLVAMANFDASFVESSNDPAVIVQLENVDRIKGSPEEVFKVLRQIDKLMSRV